MFTAGYWTQLYGIRNVLEGLVTQDVGARLQARAAGPRAEVPDNEIFGALAGASAIAIARGDYQFAIKLFGECFALAKQREGEINSQIHKGAMTFNVAVAYLRSNDFPAAMHYFELAQRETRLIPGNVGWGIYDSELFRRNFWDLLDLYQQQAPLTLYQELWGVPFSAAEARQAWAGLSDHSKLLYIVVTAERISYRRLGPEPDWPVSDSFALSYWNLIADLARLLETELLHHGFNQNGLRSKILAMGGPIAGFTAAVNALHGQHPVSDPAEFDVHFPPLRTIITDANETQVRRVAAAALLAGVTRNQVQHQVNQGMIIYTDREAAVFTADTLLTLCRLSRWVP